MHGKTWPFDVGLWHLVLPMGGLQVRIYSARIVPVRDMFQYIYWSTIYRKQGKAKVSAQRPKHIMYISKPTSSIEAYFLCTVQHLLHR